MQLKRIAVQLSKEQQARLELDLHTRFGIQVNDVFPATRADETILTFVITPSQMGIGEQLVAHLEQQKTAGIIRAVEITRFWENEDDEDENGSEEQGRSLEDDLACASSALEMLSQRWVQNVLGDEETSVLFDALNLFMDTRRQQQENMQSQTVPHPHPERLTKGTENLYVGDIKVELTGQAEMCQRRTIHLSEPLGQVSVEALAKETKGNYVWEYQSMREETVKVTILSQPYNNGGNH